MAAGRGGDPTVEEVEARRGSSCSPVVCILGVCLCLVLAALIVVTALHTHTKLQAAEDDDPQVGCPVAKTGLRAPCQPQRLNFTAEVAAAGTACANWFQFACPSGGVRANVTYAQVLLLGLARTACSGGPARVEAVMRDFFNVTDWTAQLLKPAFNC